MDSFKIAMNIQLQSLEPSVYPFKETCRVCLSETKDNNLDDKLVLNDEGYKSEITIKEMLETSIGLGINTKETLFPNHICNNCLNNLRSSHSFRLQSQNTELLLNSFIDKINTKQNQPAPSNHDPVSEICEQINEPLANNDNNLLTNESSENHEELDQHSSKKLLMCKVCNKVFRGDQTLKRHIKITCIPLELLEQCKRLDSKSVVPLQKALYACNLAIEVVGFSCSFCNKNFKTEKDFSNHLHEHDNEKKCHICNRLFGRTLYLESHLKKHLNYTPYKCPYCIRVYYSVFSIRSHVKKHSNRAHYVCNICDADFNIVQKFVRHMKKHELEKIDIVPIFGSKNMIDAAESQSDTPNDEHETYSLSNCDLENRAGTFDPTVSIEIKEEFDIEIKQNAISDTLKEEIQTFDMDEQITSKSEEINIYPNNFHKETQGIFFEVTELPENQKTGVEIKTEIVDSVGLLTEDDNHIEMDVETASLSSDSEVASITSNNSEKYTNIYKTPEATNRFTCQIADCNKEFVYRSLIIYHYINDHCTKNQPLQCPICLSSEKFIYKRDLRQHLKTAHSYNKYDCKHCSKTFKTLRAIEDHTRLHTNERPFSCPECYSKFKNRSSLKVHIVTHEKNKTFCCSVCSRKFFSYNGLFLHSKSHIINKELECKKCGKQCPTKYRLKLHIAVCGSKKYIKNSSASTKGKKQ